MPDDLISIALWQTSEALAALTQPSLPNGIIDAMRRAPVFHPGRSPLHLSGLLALVLVLGSQVTI